jgi:hypothetical protein
MKMIVAIGAGLDKKNSLFFALVAGIKRRRGGERRGSDISCVTYAIIAAEGERRRIRTNMSTT